MQDARPSAPHHAVCGASTRASHGARIARLRHEECTCRRPELGRTMIDLLLVSVTILFRALLGVRERGRSPLARAFGLSEPKEPFVSLEYSVGLILSVLLAGYLVYAAPRPERFRPRRLRTPRIIDTFTRRGRPLRRCFRRGRARTRRSNSGGIRAGVRVAQSLFHRQRSPLDRTHRPRRDPWPRTRYGPARRPLDGLRRSSSGCRCRSRTTACYPGPNPPHVLTSITSVAPRGASTRS